MVSTNIKNRLHNLIDVSHIYKTKPESWFKFVCLAIAWFGGFFWLTPSINITQYSLAFFVYSVALFMEYIIKLISSTRFPGKIYPLLIVLCGTFIFFDSISQWRNWGPGFLPLDALNVFAFIPVVILFTDTLFITMIEKNEKTLYEPEKNLLKERDSQCL